MLHDEFSKFLYDDLLSSQTDKDMLYLSRCMNATYWPQVVKHELGRKVEGKSD